ncbi:SAM-dependent methyltransferase [Gordonia sp. NPDC003422]
MSGQQASHDELPFAARKTEDMPGHWLLARLGKLVLRPGGRELTEQLLDDAELSDADVLEIAPGLGKTARSIIDRNPKTYVGVVVAIGEAMLTMQSDRAKADIVAEAFRVLRPGGRYAIHELALHPDTLPDEAKTEIRKQLARSIKVNARPLTEQEWRKLLTDAGFEIAKVGFAKMALLQPRRVLADEGPLRTLKFVGNVLRDKDARSRVLGMRATFTKYRDQLAAIEVIAVKPNQS